MYSIKLQSKGRGLPVRHQLARHPVDPMTGTASTDRCLRVHDLLVSYHMHVYCTYSSDAKRVRGSGRR